MGKFDDLPNEIILEVLIRLPAESVLESKSVCKPWRDLVRHPSFSQTHLTQLNSGHVHRTLGFVIISRESGLNEIYYTEYDENCDDTFFNRKTKMKLIPPSEGYILAGSCDGLICFNSWSNSAPHLYGPAYICNPITREYVILPKCGGQYVNYWWTGFGHSHLTNEYKVVRIYKSGGDSNVGIIQAYTLGSGTGWRNAGTMDINMKYVKASNGVFSNGVLHWVDEQGTTILAFHLADEKFSKFSSPHPCLTEAGGASLVVTLGILGVLVNRSGGCDIWLLKKKKGDNEFSWSKEFCFDRNIQQPLNITKSGRLLSYEDSNIYSYDQKTSSAKMDVSFGKPISQPVRHMNTLISLKLLGEKDTKWMESSERVGSREETVNMIN